MATSHPHVPAAFINAIAEEGTKAEAIEYLQKTWNELCALKSRVAQSPELTHSPALEHGADGYFRPASLRTIIARAALAVIEKPDGVETLDWQIADAVIAMLPKSPALDPATVEACAKLAENYLLGEPVKISAGEFIARNEIARRIRALLAAAPCASKGDSA